MDKSKAKILFWVNGYVASAEDRAEAKKLDANVHFRNAFHVPSIGALEKCDGVAGAVPKRYAETYPTAQEAIAKFEQNQLEVEQIVGDSKPPVIEDQNQQNEQNVVKNSPNSKLPAWGSSN